jgi:Flp pilus assembly pilin Flp
MLLPVHHPGLIHPEAAMFQVLVLGRRDEQGQGLAEYALILGLLAVVAIAALVFMGSTISMLLSQIGAIL